MGHEVRVRHYGLEHKLPTGIRHLYYLLRIVPDIAWCDRIVALDTFSVGFPAAVGAALFSKRLAIRTGGDFLWEGYVERTGNKILLREFYAGSLEGLDLKERLIFKLSKWTLHRSTVIFSTVWHRDIWSKPYGLDMGKAYIVENYYGGKEPSEAPQGKTFVGGARNLVWKNLDTLKAVFDSQDVREEKARLETQNYPFERFMQIVKQSYAVILVSLGDISPNMILDAIRHNKPFIITRENGLMDRIGNIAITADPMDKDDIEEKVKWLCTPDNYQSQMDKISKFDFVHSWKDIANEIIDICNKA
jgi:hypothetical protein